MDSSAVPWLSSETELDNPIFTDQFDFVNSFDEELAAILGGDFDSSPEKNSSSSSTLINVPSTNSISSFCTSSPPPPPMTEINNSSFSMIEGLSAPDRPSSMPIILNFENNANTSPENPKHANPGEEAVVSQILRSQGSLPNPEDQPVPPQNTKRTSRVRPASQIYDHILAERKRREQLSQHFLALSTIVPGLKKMDKTSVLGDAINYLKSLQEKVKTLEEQATNKSMESVVLVKKSRIMMENDDRNQSFEEQPLPEIEARVTNSQMLIRIHSENQRGLLSNLIGEVEKLNLTIVNTNVTSFGTLALEITIVTKMEKEFNLTVNEVVKKLHAAIKNAQ